MRQPTSRPQRLGVALILIAAAILAGCDLAVDAVPDRDPPRVRVDEPGLPYLAITSDSILRVAGRAIDNEAVERITYLVGNTEHGAGVQPDAVVTFSFETAILGRGDSLEVRAYDRAGNRGQAVIPLPVYDGSPPVLELTIPPPGAWTNGTFRIAGIARDDLGIDRVTVERDGLLAVLPAEFDTVLTIDRSAQVGIVAHDRAGHRSVMERFYIAVDRTAPAIVIENHPISVRDAETRILLDVGDRDAGVETLRYVTVEDTVEVSSSSSLYRGPITVPAGPGGVIFIAKDGVGNVSSARVEWLDQEFVSLSSAGAHSCVLTSAGSAYCFGPDDNGQLGDGPDNGRGVVRVAGEHLFSSIATGLSTTCATTAEGTAYCWGDNRFGQLGDGSRIDQSIPVPVQGDHRYIEIHPGIERTCALGEEGTVYCWGLLPRIATDGEVVVDTVTAPRPITAPERLVLIRMDQSGSHACGLDAVGAAYCWGQTSGYDGDAVAGRLDTMAVRVGDGPYQLVHPVSGGGLWEEAWTIALTEGGVPVSLGGTGPGWDTDIYPPYHDILALQGWPCLVAASKVDSCVSSLGPAIAAQHAARMALEATVYSGSPCFLIASGALYCKPH